MSLPPSSEPLVLQSSGQIPSDNCFRSAANIHARAHQGITAVPPRPQNVSVPLRTQGIPGYQPTYSGKFIFIIKCKCRSTSLSNSCALLVQDLEGITVDSAVMEDIKPHTVTTLVSVVVTPTVSKMPTACHPTPIHPVLTIWKVG